MTHANPDSAKCACAKFAYAKPLLAAVALLGLAATVQPAAAFFGSFAASCRGIEVYGGGAFMTAYCQRLDGSWRFARIANCGGAGVRNDDGFLRCGTE